MVWLSGWMKAQIRGKTRNRGRNWVVFHRPDEKTAAGCLVGFMARDALTVIIFVNFNLIYLHLHSHHIHIHLHLLERRVV
jgi:hypothetical protein